MYTFIYDHMSDAACSVDMVQFIHFCVLLIDGILQDVGSFFSICRGKGYVRQCVTANYKIGTVDRHAIDLDFDFMHPTRYI